LIRAVIALLPALGIFIEAGYSSPKSVVEEDLSPNPLRQGEGSRRGHKSFRIAIYAAGKFDGTILLFLIPNFDSFVKVVTLKY
jgi:hypothetical protein